MYHAYLSVPVCSFARTGDNHPPSTSWCFFILATELPLSARHDRTSNHVSMFFQGLKGTGRMLGTFWLCAWADKTRTRARHKTRIYLPAALPFIFALNLKPSLFVTLRTRTHRHAARMPVYSLTGDYCLGRLDISF